LMIVGIGEEAGQVLVFSGTAADGQSTADA
jgi:hypothetical protein